MIIRKSPIDDRIIFDYILNLERHFKSSFIDLFTKFMKNYNDYQKKIEDIFYDDEYTPNITRAYFDLNDLKRVLDEYFEYLFLLFKYYEDKNNRIIKVHNSPKPPILPNSPKPPKHHNNPKPPKPPIRPSFITDNDETIIIDFLKVYFKISEI